VETLRARRAVPADTAEVTRLREVMFADMGEGGDDRWWSACEADLRAAFAGDWTAAFVLDAPDGAGLACAVVGTLDRRLPGPGRLGQNIVVGHVSSMATDPRWRRRGMARVALQSLLEWFAARGAVQVGLTATADGEALYRSLGFTEPANRALRLSLSAETQFAPSAPPDASGSAVAGLAGSSSPGVGGELAAGDAQP